MIFIAKRTKDGSKVGIKEIAKEIDAPEHFIAKILQELIKKELLQSLKGPTGGFYLNKNSLQCSLADIVKAIDGDKIFSGCGLGLDYCSEIKPCPIHNEFKKVRKDIHDMLQSVKLDELQEQLEGKLAYLKQR
jgi:Rrf2 family protein